MRRSNRFMSATTLRYVICAASTCHWRSVVLFPLAMMEPEGADEGSFFPMVVPLSIGRWSLH